MNPLIIFAYLFVAPIAPMSTMAPWPQEPPPKQEDPPKQAPPPKQEEPPKQAPPPKQEPTNPAREAALAAIRGARPVSDERTRPDAPPNSPSETAARAARPAGGRGATAPRAAAGTLGASGASSAASRAAASSAANAAAARLVTITDAEREASFLLVSNALFQAELAKRRQIISLDEIKTPEAAMAELEAGNIRFMKGWRSRTLLASQDSDLRAALGKGQSPFAVIVTCSDSRAVDNLIFDQELGRLFSIRVAGNSPDTLGIASIEYAVEHLGSKVVAILGHTRCGAIGAVADAHGRLLPDNMFIFQELMEGLLEAFPRDPNETDVAYKDRLEKENAMRQAQAVYERSRIIREFVDEKKIWLLPASYDLLTGQVTFFRPVEGKPHE